MDEQCQFEEHSGIVARIFRSNDGGPIRRILNGRRRGRTGTFISYKADLRAMPWESREGELPVLRLAEVCSGVAGLLAQPHRLELSVIQQREPLIYFPDMELWVDDALWEGLRRGASFWKLAVRPRTAITPRSRCRRVVVEVKRDNDPRLDDPWYLTKLDLAGQIYSRLGQSFLIIRSDEIPTELNTRLKRIADARHTTVTLRDFDVLRSIYRGRQMRLTYAEVVQALGGGPVGFAKIAAFQVRRVLSIDLRDELGDDSLINFPGW